MKRFVAALCALSLFTPPLVASVDVERTEGKPEIVIKVNKDGSDDSKIVFNVEVSGTNDRDIQEIVKLISAFMQKLDSNSGNPLVATQSWASRHPMLLAVLAAGVTAAAGGLYLYMKA